MSMYFYFLIAFLIFLVICRFLFNDNFTKRKVEFDVKGYSVFYQDSKTDDENIISGQLLSSKEYNIKGKPDFILKHNTKDEYIPIELKSGKIADDTKPHDGDFLQLISYFVLIEEEFQSVPKYGKLIYKDYMFIIKNKPKYKKQLVKVLEKMRKMLKTGKIGNIETSYVKCKYCLCNNTVCEVKK